MLGNRSEDPRSLETIAKHGTDSRYYVMIRNWLVQVKSGVESPIICSQTNSDLSPSSCRL
jgi:hypothetical protein